MDLFLYYSTATVRFIHISTLFLCGVNWLVISVCICNVYVRGTFSIVHYGGKMTTLGGSLLISLYGFRAQN